MSQDGSSFWLRNRYLVHVFGRPRLVASILVGIAAYLLMPVLWHFSTRLLMACNIGTWLYIVLAVWMMSRATGTSIRRNAVRTDESRFIVLTLAILATIASVGAIFAQLSAVKDAQAHSRSAWRRRHGCLTPGATRA